MLRKAWERFREDCRHFYKVGAGVLIVLFILMASDQTICFIRNLTGLPCPGCGMSRSLLLLLQGKWKASWQMHPFVWAWLLYIAALAIERYFLGRCDKWHTPVLLLIAGGMLIRYFYGMLYLFPVQEPFTYNDQNLLQLLLTDYYETLCEWSDAIHAILP